MTKPLREQHLDNDPKNITILQLYESILDTARMIAENKAEEHGLDGSESKIPEPVKLARVNVQWAEALCQAIEEDDMEGAIMCAWNMGVAWAGCIYFDDVARK